MVAGRESKPHIGIFGRCNAGKSSLLNFITDADVAIVSPEGGTTTDPVAKSYEILDFAPVVLIDTAGVDDFSPLGRERVRRTMEVIPRIDLALVVYRAWGDPERELTGRLVRSGVPVIAVRNCQTGEVGPAVRPSWDGTSGSVPAGDPQGVDDLPDGVFRIAVPAVGGDASQRDALLAMIRRVLPEKSYKVPSMFAGRVAAGDRVLLVCPVDSEAPAGRLILPQVQAIRELLDLHAVALVVQPGEIGRVMSGGDAPRLVVTDSQLFGEVMREVAGRAEVTSFSVLLAAAKGDMKLYTEGLAAVDRLCDGDRVLVVENCSHQVSCEDIGRVKIPRWLCGYTGAALEFTTVAGLAPLPDDLASYALMVQCGGCMVTRSQLQNRIRQAAAAGVPVTNYGMLIRKLQVEK